LGTTEEIAALRLEIGKLRRDHASLKARLEMLDAAVRVRDHARAELNEENKRLRDAVRLIENGIDRLGVVIITCETSPTEESWKEALDEINNLRQLAHDALTL